MRILALEMLILVRLLANEGYFLDQRRMPNPRRSSDLTQAIRRPWRRGRRPRLRIKEFTIKRLILSPATENLRLKRRLKVRPLRLR